MPTLLDRADTLSHFKLESRPRLPAIRSVLMCPPDYFDVIDVKNPFMEGQIGKVNPSRARQQWGELKKTFEKLGKPVELIRPVPGLEDMVFASNQTLPGLSSQGEKICVLSRMKHPSRQKEVPAYETWFREKGYRIQKLAGSHVFEGEGDGLWHPGRHILWGGYGQRSEAAAYSGISEIFDVPVILLELPQPKFYHLDTCFCPLTETAVLFYPPAFSPAGIRLIERFFPTAIEAPKTEAEELMACNAAVLDSQAAVIQKGCGKTVKELKKLGLDVAEVDTSEFMKSGGSVFCLEMFVF